MADKKKRAPAFGLALATFGLSFCLGPVSGSYIARQFGEKSVFFVSFVLVLINIAYIALYLPETVKVQLPANVSQDKIVSDVKRMIVFELDLYAALYSILYLAICP